MPKFEIQHYTLCDGWVNTWTDYDAEGNEKPCTFDSIGDAVDALDWFLEEEDQAYFNGYIEDRYTRDEFRVVEVVDPDAMIDYVKQINKDIREGRA